MQNRPEAINSVRAFLARPSADVLALVAGALVPLAFAPVSFFPLAVLAPAALFLLWLGVSPRRALWRGLWFGVGQFGVGVSWVYVAIHDFGHSGVPLAVFLTVLFCGVMVFFPTVLGYSLARFFRGPEWLRLTLVFPAGWTFAEWLRGWILTGFPWLNLGYSQIDAPLRGLAPIVGVYGVTLAVAISAGLVALLLYSARRTQLIAATVFGVLWLSAWGLTKIEWTQPSAPPLRVSLIQGNIPQDSKWRPELVQYTLDLYAKLTREHWDSRLILWPEAAVTAFHHEVADDYLAGLAREARTHGSDIVLGIPVLDRETRRYYNSLVSVGATPGVYHKRHLVPFGDFVPLAEFLRGLISFFDLPMSGFSAGPARQPLLSAAGQKLATAICYEDIFGEELIESLPEATLLVNATNNAWYGDSFAPHQHLEMSRMRALETGRYMLRVTTNGVSALIDERGRILQRSKQFATQVISGDAIPHQGTTPYILLGNWPTVSFFSLILLAMLGRSLPSKGAKP